VPSGGSQGVEDKAAGGLADKIAGRNPLRYDAIYQRAIRAWDRSQSEKKIEVVEQSAATDAEGGASKKEKRLIRTETHAADSSLLTKALDALKAIDRLKQDSPPQKTDIAAADGGTIPMSSLSVEDFHSLSDLQLDALEARLLEKYGKDFGDARAEIAVPQLRVWHVDSRTDVLLLLAVIEYRHRMYNLGNRQEDEVPQVAARGPING
jgi:hypothetical protein